MSRGLVCREDETDLLESFVAMGPLLDVLLVHGMHCGKTVVVRNSVRTLDNVSYVDCANVISMKEFYTKTLEKVGGAAGFAVDHLNKFSNALENAVVERRLTGYHYLVFENFEELTQFASVASLVTGFAKMLQSSHAISAHITMIVSVNAFNLDLTDFSEINNYSIPTIFFKTYTQNEIKRILTDSATSELLLSEYCQFPLETEKKRTAQQKKFWADFIALVLETYYTTTGPDIAQLIEIILKIWPEFTRDLFSSVPVRYDGFLLVYKKNQRLFKNESLVRNSIQASSSLESKLGIDLPIFAKYILCAAYLASFIEPKNDFVVFSKLKDLTSRKVYRGRLRGRKSKSAELRFASPNSFELERLFAILQVIYEDCESVHERSLFDLDFYTQLSNLVSLNLITKTSGNKPSSKTDLLSPKLKFKANFGFEFTEHLAQDIDLKIGEYLVE